MSAAEATESEQRRESPVPDSSPRKRGDPTDPGHHAESPVAKDSNGARDTPQNDAAKKTKRPMSPRKRALLIAGAVLLVLGGLSYWWHGTYFEDTDDAQIDGYISSVSARVGGTVTAVL